ncbi:hypothetical protein ONZ45_g3961 [Pleurotus djamor]|nr:hypothetical protein ONZ45_g3961 [Pleurotus djamor]
MYPSKNEKIVIDEAEKLMVETMARYDPSHDAYHVQRVRKTALVLAESLAVAKPDLLVVELAALLHDVLDKKYVSAEEASDPYKYFLPFFQRTLSLQNDDTTTIDLVADGRARQIAKIVDNISWKTEKKLREAGQLTEWHRECVELHCVQDADRLDAIGAFGVLRCAAYSAVTNHALYTPSGDPGEETSAIQHFHDKLLHISAQLKTEPGKKMGAKRHEMLKQFLAAVKDEASSSASSFA